MRAFHILLEDDGSGRATRVEFEAESEDFALAIAQGHAGGRDTQLWEGARLLGSLSKDVPDLWRLS